MYKLEEDFKKDKKLSLKFLMLIFILMLIVITFTALGGITTKSIVEAFVIEMYIFLGISSLLMFFTATLE